MPVGWPMSLTVGPPHHERAAASSAVLAGLVIVSAKPSMLLKLMFCRAADAFCSSQVLLAVIATGQDPAVEPEGRVVHTDAEMAFRPFGKCTSPTPVAELSVKSSVSRYKRTSVLPDGACENV